LRSLEYIERARTAAAKVKPAIDRMRARVDRDARRLHELALAVQLWDEGWVLERYARQTLGGGPRAFYTWSQHRQIKRRYGQGAVGRRWVAVPLADLEAELQRRHRAAGANGKNGMIAALLEAIVRDLEERLGDLGFADPPARSSTSDD
jgi:hypothetical protein